LFWIVPVALAGWLAGGLWLVPHLIRNAHDGRGLALLAAQMPGRDQASLDAYLTLWLSVWRTASLAVVGGCVVVLLWLLARPRFSPAFDRLLRGEPEISGARFLWLALWSGALAGIAEAAHRFVRQLIEQRPQGYVEEVIWMGPLSAILAFGLIGVLVLAVARVSLASRRFNGPVAIRTATLLLGFPAVISVLQSPRLRLSSYAVVLLAAGLAVLISRVAVAHPRRLLELMRVSTPILALSLIATTAIGILATPRLAERRSLAALPEAEPGVPDVLLIILDTVRALNLSAWGYERSTTPTLERLAAEGAAFDRAMATAPWTLPSHASMFTGRLPFEMTADRTLALDDAYPTLAETLSRRGYATAGFVANLAYASDASGLDRGFARYEDYPVGIRRFLTSSWLARLLAGPFVHGAVDRWGEWQSGRKDAERNTQDFIDWLDRHGEQPFFVFLNYIDAHANYAAPARFRSRFPREQPIVLDVREGITEADLRGTMAAYDAAIAYVDEQISRVLDALRERGRLENTLVIVTSDHGEHFGEHGLQLHGNSLYLPLLHVPLVLWNPGSVPSGLRVPALVSLRDIPATVLDLLGGGSDVAFPGSSLTRFWRDGATPVLEPVLAEVSPSNLYRPWEPVYHGAMESLLLGEYHYILDGAGREELYHTRRDPDEEFDISERPESRSIIETMRRSLRAIVGDVRIPDAGNDAP
jgi:arylsulfatase A-like enzyme